MQEPDNYKDDHDDAYDDQDMDDATIAVVGMACHLPGALNIEEYWTNLRDGVESVHFFSDEELLAAGESAANLANPDYVRAQPLLKNFDKFDAKFWGFSPQDAAVTDPAHRMFLEVAYQAIEHAGHTAYDSEGKVGVFASSGASQYWMDNLKSNPQLIEEMGEFLVRHTGNDMNFLATRLSYELDLRGPSLNIQTACSSTIVGVHMAIQSLLGSECDTAVVGGATVLLPQQRGYVYKEGEILSPDGHCRPFDSQSAGTVFGSGAGAVVLRRLEDALEDGDTIYAVVAGSAINNDGAQKIGYLAPGVDGQASAISESLEISGVDAEDISYIEAHGTGTQVGDPIEFEALNQVYREATTQRHYCRVGSVKSNIGHLGEAAGVASLIKVVLSLQNKQLPPSINYQAPNVDIELDDSPFIINDRLVDWEKQDSNKQRLAGITALGAGGTNAHIIVGEAPEPEVFDASEKNKQLLVLSAKTSSALDAACRNLAAALREQPELNLADVTYTLQIGRRAYKYRRAIAVSDCDEAIFLLEGGDAKRVSDYQADEREPSLVFTFPGGGAQYAGMGTELYQTEAVYREAFDACINCLDAELASKVKSLVFASAENLEAASSDLERPSNTLPALFATEYALAKYFINLGAKPAAFIGHSMGEYTAACLAGVMQLNDAVNLVALRGRLFERVSLGGMLSIALSESKARELLPEQVDIAAVNAPDLCVASGPVERIETLQAELEAQQIDCTRIRINVAAHSSMLDEVLEEFRQFCQTVKFSKPEIPFTSNYTGGWISDDQATDPDYWVNHLRNTVRFADNVATVLADDERVLLEIGPGRTLTNLAQAGEVQARATLNSMRHPNEACSDVEYALRTYGHLWATGLVIDWSELWGDERRRRIAIPGYAFERKAYWIDPGVAVVAENDASGSLSKRTNMDDWFGRLSWQQSSLPIVDNAESDADSKSESSATSNTWLIFADEVGVSQAFIESLDASTKIITVKQGESFSQFNDDSFALAANDLSQFTSLFKTLEVLNKTPQQILYFWPTTSAADNKASSHSRLQSYDHDMQCYFWGLFNLSKALCEFEESVRLTVVSSDMQSIGGNCCPEKATLLGAVAVLPHESPHINTQSIDISAQAITQNGVGKIAKQIAQEILSANDDRVVAYRGADRWVRNIVSAPPQQTAEESTDWLKVGGSYLITGGLGGIGLTIAKQLAELGAGHLILLGRSQMPEKAQWSNWIEQHAANDLTSQRIQSLQAIESLGAKVSTLAVNVVDAASMQKILGSFAEVNGVIHAAGTMDDELIMLKSAESAQAVIDAKVKGALILDSIFDAAQLDFFVVFSSISSYLGLPGQIDYTAANAFLDAFAIERSQRASGQSIAINWNAWRDVGMVVNGQSAINEGHETGAEMQLSEHPGLDYFIDLSADKTRRLFTTEFDTEQHWLLSEHRVKQGDALMPGTGFVELLRAAFDQHCSSLGSTSMPETYGIELSGLQFMTAFQVADDIANHMHISVSGNQQEAALTIYSETEEMPHVIGSAALIASDAVNQASVDIESLRQRCTQSQPTAGKFLDQDFMAFGPRWACISSINSNQHEALLEIELPAEFAADLQDYKIHPGLLDMALGAAQFLITGFSKSEDFYVPIAYEKLRYFSAMPSAFVSHVRYDKDSPVGFARFDVTLMDETGKPFVEVEGFTMKKIEGSLTSSLDARANNQADALAELLREAILPTEGIEAFNRVMSQDTQAQWIVSSVDTRAWLQQLNSADGAQSGQSQIQYVRENIHDPDADEDIPAIEQVLVAHEAVESAIVRSFLDENDDRRLISYFLPDYDFSVTVSELRRYAKENLEANYIPQQFIELDELPVDDKGNEDRAQLRDPFAPEDNYVEPQTDSEKALAKIWCEVLGVDRVGLVDNFFDLGGHSLLSIRIILRVDKNMGVRLEATTLAMHTLEQVANEIDAHHLASGKTQGKSSDVTAIDSRSGDAAKHDDSSTPESSSENSQEKQGKGFFSSVFGRK